jgi:hypothetical protein
MAALAATMDDVPHGRYVEQSGPERPASVLKMRAREYDRVERRSPFRRARRWTRSVRTSQRTSVRSPRRVKLTALLTRFTRTLPQLLGVGANGGLRTALAHGERESRAERSRAVYGRNAARAEQAPRAGECVQKAPCR